MKCWTCLVVLGAVVVACGCGETTRRSGLDMDYVTSQERFLSEKNGHLTDAERKAIAIARKCVAARCGRPMRGKFSVARTRVQDGTGYQVSFHSVETRNGDGRWTRVREGFGDVVLASNLNVRGVFLGP